MIEHSDKNCETLASDIVEGWDLDSVIEFAVETLKDRFENDEENFQETWKEYYSE